MASNTVTVNFTLGFKVLWERILTWRLFTLRCVLVSSKASRVCSPPAFDLKRTVPCRLCTLNSLLAFCNVVTACDVCHGSHCYSNSASQCKQTVQDCFTIATAMKPRNNAKAAPYYLWMLRVFSTVLDDLDWQVGSHSLLLAARSVDTECNQNCILVSACQATSANACMQLQ